MEANVPAYLTFYRTDVPGRNVLPDPLNPVFSAHFKSLSAHAIHIGKLTSEGHEARNLERRANLLLDDIKNLRCRQPFGSLVVIVVHRCEEHSEVLLDRLQNLVASVPLHYLLRLRLIEPRALAMSQHLQGLGEYLPVVGHPAHVDRLRQLYADKASVARRIGKDVGHVACGDEGSPARQVFLMVAIRTLRLDSGQLDDVLGMGLPLMAALDINVLSISYY